MILLTKAHLLFMADYAWLPFQMRVLRGLPASGICARAFGAKFRQIRQAPYITGDTHQIVAADIGGKFPSRLERAKTKLNQRLRITLDGSSSVRMSLIPA